MDPCIDTSPVSRDDLIPRLGVRSGPFNARSTGDNVIGPRERLLEEVGGLEDHIDDTEFGGLCRPQLLVLIHRVVDDHVQRPLGPDEVRQQPRPAPPGHQSKKDLRQGESRRTGVEGAVVAVQGQFETTAHGRAVDECERGNG